MTGVIFGAEHADQSETLDVIPVLKGDHITNAIVPLNIKTFSYIYIMIRVISLKQTVFLQLIERTRTRKFMSYFHKQLQLFVK